MVGRNALAADRTPSPGSADSGVSIRPMTLDDLDAVLVIERAAFSPPWTREMFRAEVSENPCARFFVAETAHGLVGYVGGWVVLDEMQVVSLAVRPDARRRKIASRLLERLFEAAGNGLRRASLEVRRSNRAAIAIYQRFGFRQAGVRVDYYDDPTEDALLMEWVR
ncbi:MAG: ribosomal protein S18-alanine N-acetyltransferase [Nitrospirota bacterium]